MSHHGQKITAHQRVLALTPGEPAGIGPDLAVFLAQESLPCRLVAIADPDMLVQRAEILGRPLRIHDWEGQRHDPGTLEVIPVPCPRPVTAGRPDTGNAGYVLDTLRRAVAGCMGGEFDALVTGPVHKGVINDAGYPFRGHTEFLAEAARAPQPVMMLMAEDLRVALVTTHLPLAEVPGRITREHLERVIRVLHGDLAGKFGIRGPTILVCGLNPHGGEGGHLGREEIEVIAPVLAELRQQGMDLVGPVPADTAFTPKRLAGIDAVLAMYHDQGLPVLKRYGFGRGVNVTLGLPFIRTSVDHGTALDLAGTGRVDMGSLHEAIRVAIEMSEAQ